MSLDVQIQVYSVDTGNFYTAREKKLHWLNHKLKIERNELQNKLSKIEKYLNSNDINEITRLELNKKSDAITKLIDLKKEKIKNTKNKLLSLLSNKVSENIKTNGKHHTRTLNENTLSDKNIISVFESNLTRYLKNTPDEFTDDFMVVQTYYFDIIKDIIYFGFEYKGEKYIYFTSSAGQIRQKKCVFIRESAWKSIEKKVMCGLTLDIINQKGGNNSNKHLAYTALSNSATDEWKNFDIDKCIVIDDFETNVFGTYDFVNDIEYTIERKQGEVPIPHTDGAGMILPNAFGEKQRNKMFRPPWIKGLLGVFDFKMFIVEHNCSPIIKDIYGKEWNVLKDDIQVIITKSQFKLWKFYDSWQDYKDKYKENHCITGYTNMEEDKIKNSKINYQMLQTLTDVSDTELLQIANKSITKLNNLCSSLKNVENLLGIDISNKFKTPLQKSIELYPDLINDEYLKMKIRQTKDCLLKRYRSGKLEVNGKYTFVLPDFYAACEHWFLGIDKPKGLLENGEVFCWLFRNSSELDCLRSPHLYKEHAVRKNMAYIDNYDVQKDMRKWFVTNAIYTSSHDLITKILMLDVDGDKLLVISDKTIIDIAKRNMKNIVPLYYDMKKAHATILNNETIYNGLISAFTGSNIGQYSNNITKIWNSDIFINGNEEQKQEAIDMVKILCMENNYVIDRAKTLYMPTRPKRIAEILKEYTNKKLPHFFIYAKDSLGKQVEPKNKSIVNRLFDIIPNPRINCRKLGLEDIDYTYLMKNPDIKFDAYFDENNKIISDKTEPLLVKYIELNKNYHYKIDSNRKVSTEFLRKSQIKQELLIKSIIDKVKFELSKFGYDEDDVSDILVKYLYGIKKSKHKDLLWACYGENIYNNLSKNFKLHFKLVSCIECDKLFYIPYNNKNTCRCVECQSKLEKINRKFIVKRQKQNNKGNT